MKRILFLFAALLISLTTFAQSTGISLTPEQIQRLDPATKANIMALQAEQRTDQLISTGSKWIGLGKEIGTAVNESLVSLTKTAGDFSETKLGKFTMFLVAYKVIGTDLLQVAFGVLWVLLVLSVSFMIHWRYARDKRVLSREKFDDKGKVIERSYEINHGSEEFAVTAVVVLIVGLLISIPIFLV